MRSHRIGRLRRQLARRGGGAVLISSLPLVRYLSGFTGSHALCVVTQQERVLLTDSRYAQQSKEEAPSWRRHITTKPLWKAAGMLPALRRSRRVCIEEATISWAEYRQLRGALPRRRVLPADALLEALTLVKDDEELALLRKAAAISDRAFRDILPIIRPGVRELDIAAELSYLQRRLGAERDAFDCIVASGPRSALPHARASMRRVHAGEPVLLDFGAVVGGYCSDLTRTVFVGRVPGMLRDMYNAVAEAQRCAIAEAMPGLAARALDAVARESLTARGYGALFTHSLGHGVGLRVHERPRVSQLSRDVLVTGSTFTIEPGVYLEGLGGVRIEDDVLLGPAGCTVLNHAPKELLIL